MLEQPLSTFDPLVHSWLEAAVPPVQLETVLRAAVGTLHLGSFSLRTLEELYKRGQPALATSLADASQLPAQCRPLLGAELSGQPHGLEVELDVLTAAGWEVDQQQLRRLGLRARDASQLETARKCFAAAGDVWSLLDLFVSGGCLAAVPVLLEHAKVHLPWQQYYAFSAAVLAVAGPCVLAEARPLRFFPTVVGADRTMFTAPVVLPESCRLENSVLPEGIASPAPVGRALHPQATEYQTSAGESLRQCKAQSLSELLGDGKWHATAAPPEQGKPGKAIPPQPVFGFSSGSDSDDDDEFVGRVNSAPLSPSDVDSDGYHEQPDLALEYMRRDGFSSDDADTDALEPQMPTISLKIRSKVRLSAFSTVLFRLVVEARLALLWQEEAIVADVDEIKKAAQGLALIPPPASSRRRGLSVHSPAAPLSGAPLWVLSSIFRCSSAAALRRGEHSPAVQKCQASTAMLLWQEAQQRPPSTRQTAVAARSMHPCSLALTSRSRRIGLPLEPPRVLWSDPHRQLRISRRARRPSVALDLIRGSDRRHPFPPPRVRLMLRLAASDSIRGHRLRPNHSLRSLRLPTMTRQLSAPFRAQAFKARHSRRSMAQELLPLRCHPKVPVVLGRRGTPRLQQA